MISEKITDWREMEAGRELDRIVAETLRWKFVPATPSYLRDGETIYKVGNEMALRIQLKVAKQEA